MFWLCLVACPQKKVSKIMAKIATQLKDTVPSPKTTVFAFEAPGNTLAVLPAYVAQSWTYWLNILHELTGQWWLPPCPVPEPARLEKPQDLTPVATRQDQQQLKKPIRSTKRDEGQNTPSFDYERSSYFAVARALIEQTRIEAEEEPPDLQKAIRVLAFIVAWCQHPYFDRSKTVAVPGQWMAMARQRCAKELRMRPQTFIEICQWLENRGIIQTGDLDSTLVSQEAIRLFWTKVQGAVHQYPAAEIYWPARTLQKRIKLYRIIADLNGQPLPLFNPSGWQRVETEVVDGKLGRAVFVSERPKDSGLSQHPTNTETFPVEKERLHEHDSICINKDLLIDNKNHGVNDKDHAKVVDLHQEAKFNFLRRQARFEGYTGAKGRVTLDYAPARKLAQNQSLSLEQLRQVYEEVHTRWLKAEIKNPVGYFYNSLKNLTGSIHPSSSSVISTSDQNQSRFFGKSRVKTAVNPHIRPVVERVVSSHCDNSEYSKPDLPILSQFFATTPVLGIGEANWERLTIDQKLAHDLWERLYTEDLPGRFRLASSQLQLLENSEMLVTFLQEQSGNLAQVKVLLRSSLELNLLNCETRNLIRMALTQRLGTNYTLSFDVKNIQDSVAT